jgi:hypothetical protein
MRATPGNWDEAVSHPALKIKAGPRTALLTDLNKRFGPLTNPAKPLAPPTPMTKGQLKRLLTLCPCLFNQIDIAPTARGVVHFCEMALKTQITSKNVHQAFFVQHPRSPKFDPPLLKKPKSGGAIMEMLCSEALASAGIPGMALQADGWPEWKMPGHVLLNEGKMASLKAFGDILIPCAPTNIIISVKSEVARERLLYSANSIEGVGFGFFKEPSEFWTVSMSLFKRMGFSAIYMPDQTHKAIVEHLKAKGTTAHAVNINGKALYRPLTQFGGDMLQIIGKASILL